VTNRPVDDVDDVVAPERARVLAIPNEVVTLHVVTLHEVRSAFASSKCTTAIRLKAY
jgi:hypothetical protein